MDEPFYSVCRLLHGGGGWLAFAIGPFALRTVKGSRSHTLAGRCFVVCMGIGIAAGILLASIRPDFVRDLFLLGLITLFFLGTGYLAPHIGRGSRLSYRWDRMLTLVGLLASVALIGYGVQQTTSNAPIQEGVVLGGLGLGVGIAHARWRGPTDPSRWRIEHLTSLLAAYAISWSFIFGLYIRVLPPAPRVLIPAAGGILGIWWARRRFAELPPRRGPAPEALSGPA
jgi:uncharacterized membrane protein